MRENQFDPRRLQMVRQHRDSRIASGNEDAIAKIVGGVEYLNIGAAVLGSLAGRWSRGDHRVTDGKIPWNRRWRRGYQALTHAAQLHRLAGMQRLGTRQQHGLFRSQPGGVGLGESEKTLHLYLASVRQSDT